MDLNSLPWFRRIDHFIYFSCQIGTLFISSKIYSWLSYQKYSQLIGLSLTDESLYWKVVGLQVLLISTLVLSISTLFIAKDRAEGIENIREVAWLLALGIIVIPISTNLFGYSNYSYDFLIFGAYEFVGMMSNYFLAKEIPSRLVASLIMIIPTALLFLGLSKYLLALSLIIGIYKIIVNRSLKTENAFTASSQY